MGSEDLVEAQRDVVQGAEQQRALGRKSARLRELRRRERHGQRAERVDASAPEQADVARVLSVDVVGGRQKLRRDLVPRPARVRRPDQRRHARGVGSGHARARLEAVAIRKDRRQHGRTRRGDVDAGSVVAGRAASVRRVGVGHEEGLVERLTDRVQLVPVAGGIEVQSAVVVDVVERRGDNGIADPDVDVVGWC